MRRAILGFLVCLCALFVSGCLVKHKIVYVRMVRAPQEIKGAMRVATNKPVKVNVAGTAVVAKVDVGGYIVVHESDFGELVRNTQRLRTMKRRMKGKGMDVGDFLEEK